MTREEAKIYAKLSREDVAKLNSEFGIHYDIICSFANGVKIESKHPEATKWNEEDCPEFRSFMEYRVKETEIEANTAEPWKPRDGDTAFFIGTYGEIYVGCFQTYEPVGDTKRLDFGNCFRTRAEAETACERVRAALKGSTISKTETVEPVESLDGEPLTEGEKDLIRALRVSGIDGIFTEKNSCLFNGGGNCGEYTQYSDFVAIDTNVPADIEDVINALVKIREEQDKAAESAFG